MDRHINSYSILAPLAELVQNEEVQLKVGEAAKLFYSSDTVTLNLAPAILAGSLLLLCEYDKYIVLTYF